MTTSKAPWQLVLCQWCKEYGFLKDQVHWYLGVTCDGEIHKRQRKHLRERLRAMHSRDDSKVVVGCETCRDQLCGKEDKK